MPLWSQTEQTIYYGSAIRLFNERATAVALLHCGSQRDDINRKVLESSVTFSHLVVTQISAILSTV